jgi:hypothetical protein
LPEALSPVVFGKDGRAAGGGVSVPTEPMRLIPAEKNASSIKTSNMVLTSLCSLS